MTVRRLVAGKLINFGSFGNFLIIAIVFLTGVVVYLICMIATKTIPISFRPKGR